MKRRLGSYSHWRPGVAALGALTPLMFAAPVAQAQTSSGTPQEREHLASDPMVDPAVGVAIPLSGHGSGVRISETQHLTNAHVANELFRNPLVTPFVFDDVPASFLPGQRQYEKRRVLAAYTHPGYQADGDPGQASDVALLITEPFSHASTASLAPTTFDPVGREFIVAGYGPTGSASLLGSRRPAGETLGVARNTIDERLPSGTLKYDVDNGWAWPINRSGSPEPVRFEGGSGPGGSGGPAFNQAGEVFGLQTAGASLPLADHGTVGSIGLVAPVSSETPDSLILHGRELSPTPVRSSDDFYEFYDSLGSRSSSGHQAPPRKSPPVTEDFFSESAATPSPGPVAPGASGAPNRVSPANMAAGLAANEQAYASAVTQAPGSFVSPRPAADSFTDLSNSIPRPDPAAAQQLGNLVESITGPQQARAPKQSVEAASEPGPAQGPVFPSASGSSPGFSGLQFITHEQHAEERRRATIAYLQKEIAETEKELEELEDKRDSEVEGGAFHEAYKLHAEKKQESLDSMRERLSELRE